MSDYSAVAPPQNFSQSSAFAAALQRARQIAAKINPSGTNEGGVKRPLEEGSEPDPKKVANDPIASAQLSAIRAQQAAASGGSSASVAQSVAARVAAATVGGLGLVGLGGVINEDIRVPDKMVGLNGGGPHLGFGAITTEEMLVPDRMVGHLIGRGGEQISRLQNESGCKIQMAPDSGGQPERVCSLSGTRESISRAKELISAIVQQRSRTEGGTGSGGGGGGGPGVGGGGMGGGLGDMGMNSTQVEIMVPGPKVGLIIGKGGETIKQLQDKSGARMTVIQDGSMNQDQEKPLRISGDPQSVEHAKALVYELIAEKEIQNAYGRGGGGGGGGIGGGGGNRRDGHFGDMGGGNIGNGDSIEVLVPQAAVGVVIGKGGDMIKKIQSETGARVQFQQGRDDGPGERKCLLTGKPQQVQEARMRIEELIDSVLRRDNEIGRAGGRRGPGGQGGRGGYDGMGQRTEYGREENRGWDRGNRLGGPMGDKPEMAFTIPATKCGVVIGRGGETIKQINSQSGAHCEMDRRPHNNPAEKVIIIRGSPEQIETAKRLIQDKLGMPLGNPNGGGPNQYPMGGGPGGPGGAAGPGQGGPGGPPQHYNAAQNWQYPTQWQGQGHPGDSQPSAVSVNPQTGQPDYSVQWAEYYRTLGMHREADMIEQQSKTKGMQAQPQPQPAAQPQPVAQPQQASAPGAQNGQADYSAQWAEYYRSLGKLKEADAIEAQMKAAKAGQQVASQAQSGGGAAQISSGATAVQQPGYGQPYGYQAAPSYGYGAPGGPQPPQQPGQQPQYGYAAYGAYGGQPGGPEN